MALKLYSDTDIQNIANAIRAKNGSSDTYKVSEMATAIQNIPSGGSSQRKATGTFTNATDTKMPTITHNLGTTRIALIVYPTTDISYSAGYLPMNFVYVNYCQIAADDGITSVNYDYTGYNSKFTDPVNVPIDAGNTRVANGNASPWTTQSSWTSANMESAGGAKQSQNTVTTTTFTTNANKFGTGTWKWVAWALD